MAHTSSRYEEVHRARAAGAVIRDARGVRSCYDSDAFTESTGNRYVFLPVPAWPGPVADRVRLL